MADSSSLTEALGSAPSEPEGTGIVKLRAVRDMLARHVFGILLLVAMLILPLCSLITTHGLHPIDPAVLLLLGAIGVIAILNLAINSYGRPFTLDAAHWCFILMFLVFAPMVQAIMGKIPPQADPGSYLGPFGLYAKFQVKVCLLLLLWSVLYSFGYAMQNRGPRPVSVGRKDDRLVNYWLLVLISLLSVALVFVALGGGAFRLRGTAGEGAVVQTSGPVSLIAAVAIRTLPVACLFFLATRRKRSGVYYVAFALILLCALSMNHPLAVPRFYSAALGIGIFAVFMGRRRRSAVWLPVTVFLGAVVLLPLLNYGRHKELNADALSYQNPITRFATGDYEAFAMCVNSVALVDDGPGSRNGLGLASAVFFWVPRSMWPEKSPGSGVDVAHFFHFGFVNLGCPLPAEAYLDFGVPGVACYALFMGMGFGRLDRWYWSGQRRLFGLDFGGLRTAFPFMVGAAIYLMRGSLVATFGYTTGFVAMCFVAHQVSHWGVRRRALSHNASTLVPR